MMPPKGASLPSLRGGGSQSKATHTHTPKQLTHSHDLLPPVMMASETLPLSPFSFPQPSPAMDFRHSQLSVHIVASNITLNVVKDGKQLCFIIIIIIIIKPSTGVVVKLSIQGTFPNFTNI